ncbi:TPA: integrase DNA-binding domain-containing protein, partial [Staphylococcus delphini]|nr:integrase DNA-binding domain-containing protein [Staphylococcus delphini]
MSEKRRDNKGRILKTGESQRKDGRLSLCLIYENYLTL